MIKIYWKGIIDLQEQLNILQAAGIKRQNIWVIIDDNLIKELTPESLRKHEERTGKKITYTEVFGCKIFKKI